MFQWMGRFFKNEKGVTLIELLIVIVILGIIAVVAVPMFNNNRRQAAISTNQQNQAILQDAVERHRLDNNDGLPANLPELVADGYIRGQIPAVLNENGGQMGQTWTFVGGVVGLPEGAATP